MKSAVIGAQWGDEGKGKVVNFLSEHYDWVVRFSGGANAGHTIFYKGKKYVNHLLPSIPINGKTRGLLGAGMVIDLEQLTTELKTLENQFKGIARSFYIDIDAFVVLPQHKEEDKLIDAIKRKPIGTTGKGIGPAYADKLSRHGIKVSYLFDEDLLKTTITELFHLKRKLMPDITWNVQKTMALLLKKRDELQVLQVNFVSTVKAMKMLNSESVLFEGAQGILLDIDAGTYPFVTSSNCGVHNIGMTHIDRIYGVIKAYTTRVGHGPFPTEIHDKVGEMIRKHGGEYGATTGRPRRVGWLDLPALRYAKARCGLTELILTKGDVLADKIKEIKICTAYDLNGVVKEMPTSSYDFLIAKPIYTNLPGWKTLESKEFYDYVEFVEKSAKTPISYISTGPQTGNMLLRN